MKRARVLRTAATGTHVLWLGVQLVVVWWSLAQTVNAQSLLTITLATNILVTLFAAATLITSLARGRCVRGTEHILHAWVLAPLFQMTTIALLGASVLLIRTPAILNEHAWVAGGHVDPGPVLASQLVTHLVPIVGMAQHASVKRVRVGRALEDAFGIVVTTTKTRRDSYEKCAPRALLLVAVLPAVGLAALAWADVDIVAIYPSAGSLDLILFTLVLGVVSTLPTLTLVYGSVRAYVAAKREPKARRVAGVRVRDPSGSASGT